MALTQWQCLLAHLGAWDGSFARLSPAGEVVEETPTTVSLAGLDENRTIRQTIERFNAGNGQAPSVQSMEYRSLNRNILFFENGAFSLGSSQFSPLAEFGAELAFLEGDRRLRLVPLYQESQLTSITLIRERKRGSEASDRPPLTIESFIGEWEGEAKTIYPDWRSPNTYTTHLSVQRQGNHLQQRLQTPQWEMTSTARVEANRLVFEGGGQQVWVLLLPDGASCTLAPTIENRQAFRLEAGWLLDENYRQRLIRSYGDRGAWTSLTLVRERRVG